MTAKFLAVVFAPNCIRYTWKERSKIRLSVHTKNKNEKNEPLED